MRPVAKKGLQCALKCYDTLAQHGTSDALQQCVQNCEQPHQKANAIVRQVRESSIRGHDAYRTMEFFQIRIGSAFACICFERVSTYRPSLIQISMIFNASLYAGNRTISKSIGTCHPWMCRQGSWFHEGWIWKWCKVSNKVWKYIFRVYQYYCKWIYTETKANQGTCDGTVQMRWHRKRSLPWESMWDLLLFRGVHAIKKLSLKQMHNSFCGFTIDRTDSIISTHIVEFRTKFVF